MIRILFALIALICFLLAILCEAACEHWWSTHLFWFAVGITSFVIFDSIMRLGAWYCDV